MRPLPLGSTDCICCDGRKPNNEGVNMKNLLVSMKLVDTTERKVYSLQELVDNMVGDEPVDWDILKVVDEHGNINSTDCDVVVDVTYLDEQKTEEENE
jgi:hypothetical protein